MGHERHDIASYWPASQQTVTECLPVPSPEPGEVNGKQQGVLVPHRTVRYVRVQEAREEVER